MTAETPSETASQERTLSDPHQHEPQANPPKAPHTQEQPTTPDEPTPELVQCVTNLTIYVEDRGMPPC